MLSTLSSVSYLGESRDCLVFNHRDALLGYNHSAAGISFIAFLI